MGNDIFLSGEFWCLSLVKKNWIGVLPIIQLYRVNNENEYRMRFK